MRCARRRTYAGRAPSRSAADIVTAIVRGDVGSVRAAVDAGAAAASAWSANWCASHVIAAPARRPGRRDAALKRGRNAHGTTWQLE